MRCGFIATRWRLILRQANQRWPARAASFESLTAAEPLPWSDFFIARGRALADHLRVDAALAELGALQEGV
jgi:hypothetical protein